MNVQCHVTDFVPKKVQKLNINVCQSDIVFPWTEMSHFHWFTHSRFLEFWPYIVQKYKMFCLFHYAIIGSNCLLVHVHMYHNYDYVAII